MAKLAFHLTALFFVFAVAYGHSPSDFPYKDVSDGDELSSLPESNTKPTLLLPSEKTESEPFTVVELEPETAETKSIDADAKAVGTIKDLPVSEMPTVDTIPLTRPLEIVRFRPINRHFPEKRPFPFGIPFRGCRHGIKPMMKPPVHGREVSYGDDMMPAGERKDFDSEMKLPVHGREVPYGDDMILARKSKDFDPEMMPPHHRREVSYGDDMILAGESKDFDPEMFRGGVRQIPERWVRFHHHHHHRHHEGMPGFPFSRHHDKLAKQSFRRPFHGEREEEEGEREEREDGGFMDRFRKFLNHF